MCAGPWFPFAFQKVQRLLLLLNHANARVCVCVYKCVSRKSVVIILRARFKCGPPESENDASRCYIVQESDFMFFIAFDRCCMIVLKRMLKKFCHAKNSKWSAFFSFLNKCQEDKWDSVWNPVAPWSFHWTKLNSFLILLFAYCALSY